MRLPFGSLGKNNHLDIAPKGIIQYIIMKRVVPHNKSKL
jgi:hypothetical protein